MGKVFCYLHPSEQAETTCSRCLKPICSICSLYNPLGHNPLGRLCPSCLSIVRRNRTLLKVGIALLACVLLGLGGWYVLHVPRSLDTTPIKTAGDEVDRTLQVEDCDRRKIIERAETKLREGNPQQVVDLSESFFNKCGEHLRLRWLTFEAYKQLSQWDKAIGEVDRLIAQDPYDKDYRCWRGLVFEQKGDVELAIQDYRQALTLQPRLANIPFNLSTLLERAGRPCEALLPLEQFLFYHPEHREDPRVQQRLSTLYQNGSCKGYTSGRDEAIVRFSPGSPAIQCNVRVNNTATGTFIVDTGASFTTFSRKFAERLGVDRLPSADIIVQTAAGISSARLTTVDLVDVEGLRASRVSVAINVNIPDDLDGLLGLSFLARFEVYLDSRKGTLKMVRHK